jgi:hypothetical protein
VEIMSKVIEPFAESLHRPGRSLNGLITRINIAFDGVCHLICPRRIRLEGEDLSVRRLVLGVGRERSNQKRDSGYASHIQIAAMRAPASDNQFVVALKP